MAEFTRLLSAATGVGAGVAFVCYSSPRTFTFYKSVVGGFAVLSVSYEGSLDGINWYQIGSDVTLTSAATFVVDKPVKMLRANILLFTGGTSVTVDVLHVD